MFYNILLAGANHESIPKPIIVHNVEGKEEAKVGAPEHAKPEEIDAELEAWKKQLIDVEKCSIFPHLSLLN